MKRLLLVLTLVSALLVGGISTAKAAPAIPNAGCVSGWHMSQIGQMMDSLSTGDQSIRMNMWVAERFASDGTACNVYQAVGRIQTCDGFSQSQCSGAHGGEPVYFWQVSLRKAGSNADLGTYIWQVPQNQPGWTPNGSWWYFYGPYATLSCATGQIYARNTVYESPASSGVTEQPDFPWQPHDPADGDVYDYWTVPVWTC